MEKEQLKQEVEKYFQQACSELGISNVLPDVSILPERNQKAILAFYKLSVIIQWVNEGWEPNWNDANEWKHYPWFDLKSGSAGLSYSNTNSTASYTNANIGSRLCFKTRRLAREWSQKLLPLYEDYLLIK